MKRIKNLNVCDVRTQGIVRDDGIIPICTVWCRVVESHWTEAAGYPAVVVASFYQCAYCPAVSESCTFGT